MRHLNCAKCEPKEAGTRMLYPMSPLGEPAEYERVTWGIAKPPTQEQRTVRVNGDPILMDTAAYNCDRCNAEIKAGDRCYGWTVWVQGQQEPYLWELEYIEPEAKHAR